MAAELTVNWTGKAPVKTARELGKIAASGTHVNIRIDYGAIDAAHVERIVAAVDGTDVQSKRYPWLAKPLCHEARSDARHIDPHYLPWLRSLVAESVSVAA